MNPRLVLAVLPLLALPTLVAAQAAAAPASLNAPAGRRIEVPEGTEFVAVFTQALSSKTSAAGDAVKLTVDEPIVINGDTLIRAGAIVRGTITEAKGAGYMGRGGKLNMSVESVSLADGQHAKVRSSKAKGGDEKRGQTVALTVLFGPIGLLRRGNDAEIKAGTPLHLFTDEVVTIAASR
jgi:hypothetical protein